MGAGDAPPSWPVSRGTQPAIHSSQLSWPARSPQEPRELAPTTGLGSGPVFMSRHITEAGGFGLVSCLPCRVPSSATLNNQKGSGREGEEHGAARGIWSSHSHLRTQRKQTESHRTGGRCPRFTCKCSMSRSKIPATVLAEISWWLLNI